MAWWAVCCVGRAVRYVVFGVEAVGTCPECTHNLGVLGRGGGWGLMAGLPMCCQDQCLSVAGGLAAAFTLDGRG